MKEVNLLDYRADVELLVTYIPWLESKIGKKVSKAYEGDETAKITLSFPVYDTMLLNFVNDASRTGLMDENYSYTYSQYFIKNHEDEMEAIEKADIKHVDILCGILSKYVKGGMTKGNLWVQAVEEGTFLEVVKKLKSLSELWDKPFA